MVEITVFEANNKVIGIEMTKTSMFERLDRDKYTLSTKNMPTHIMRGKFNANVNGIM